MFGNPYTLFVLELCKHCGEPSPSSSQVGTHPISLLSSYQGFCHPSVSRNLRSKANLTTGWVGHLVTNKPTLCINMLFVTVLKFIA